MMSDAGPVPHAEPIPAGLVVESSTIVSFSVGSNYKFDCCRVSLCIQS